MLGNCVIVFLFWQPIQWGYVLPKRCHFRSVILIQGTNGSMFVAVPEHTIPVF